MKFRKSSTRSSPKMELLHRSSGGNKISGFKRSKSFRASVKLITKIRNQANLHITPSYDLSPITSNPKGSKSSKSKIQNLTLVTENIEKRSDYSEPIIDLKEYKTVLSEDSRKIVKDLESKLSLTSNCKVQSAIKEGDKSNQLSIKSDRFNAYENPSFMDSSLDSSMLGFFHEDNLDQVDEASKGEIMDLPSSKVQKDKKIQIENSLTVIVENEQICKKHRWCTRAKSSASKSLFRVSKEPGEKSISVATFKGYINDGYDENKVFSAQRITLPKINRQEFIINGSRNARNLPRSFKSRMGINEAYTLSEAQTSCSLAQRVKPEQIRILFVL
jgi:hypothetical protein